VEQEDLTFEDLPHKLRQYQNDKACSFCKGKCCKTMPGITHPTDWGAPNKREMLSRLKAAFISGRWALDWWEGDPRYDNHLDAPNNSNSVTYFVRPAVKNKEGEMKHASWGGECTFLTMGGCSLEHDDRPTECRALEPNQKVFTDKTVGCISKLGEKKEFTIEWLPYQKVVKEAISQAEGSLIDTPTIDYVREAARDRVRFNRGKEVNDSTRDTATNNA